jgi:DNA-directed RNA polymerase subunit E'/Rpb7
MLFVPIKFKTSVQLTPAELDCRYQERIYEKLRDVYEGNCTKFGFILQNSIEIVKRSCGNFIKQNFNGAIRFDVICRGMTCNPPINSFVEAVVKNKNLLGILAESTMEIENQSLN